MIYKEVPCGENEKLYLKNLGWGTKAWGANWIRYPGSPCRKIWTL